MTDSELRELYGDDGGSAGRVMAHRNDDATTATTEASPTVLTTDRWTRRKGERLAEAWREALADGDGDDDLDAIDDANQIVATVDAMCDPNVAADAIETLLSPKPTMSESPADEHRARWWKQLIDAPETTSLRSRTVASAPVAEIAAAELASAYAKYVVENPPKGDGEAEGGEDGEEESPEDAVARMRSTRAAVKAATNAAEEAEAVGAGLGLGEGAALDGSAVAKYTRRLRASGNLAAIMRMAGRFIAKAQRLQRQRTNLSGMEITGVELSGDLARVLPLEAAQIAGVVPELETLALLKLAERRALSYRRIRREPQEMGPIVFSLDESASMTGQRIAAGKGLALAMASIARAQKRPFMLVAWSGDRTIRTVRHDAGTEAIVEWLEGFFGGGTSLEGPLWTLTQDAWPEGKIGAQSDHIIVTDDDVGIAPWLLDHYKAWAKGTNVRTFGIGVGVRKAETLAKFCDGGVWTLPTLDLDNAAVEVVLSIGPTYK